MLTKATAYSQWPNVDPLVLNIINKPEEDLFEVRNIDGLTPVKADINTTQLGSINKASFIGSSSGQRNIVLLLGLNPNWNEWTVSRLRRLLDKYFSPHQYVRLVFESMEFSPVEISGYVESNEQTIFSKDPEHQISIICPEPDFVSVDERNINGFSNEGPVELPYEGNIEAGAVIQVTKGVGGPPDPAWINIQLGDPLLSEFRVNHSITDMSDLQVSSIPGEKFVHIRTLPGPVITNSLRDLTEASEWPTLRPESNPFQVVSNEGLLWWNVNFRNRFGSL